MRKWIILFAAVFATGSVGTAGEELMPLRGSAFSEVSARGDVAVPRRATSQGAYAVPDAPQTQVNSVRLKLPSVGTITGSRPRFVEVGDSDPEGRIDFGQAKPSDFPVESEIPGLIAPEVLALDQYAILSPDPVAPDAHDFTGFNPDSFNEAHTLKAPMKPLAAFASVSSISSPQVPVTPISAPIPAVPAPVPAAPAADFHAAKEAALARLEIITDDLVGIDAKAFRNTDPANSLTDEKVLFSKIELPPPLTAQALGHASAPKPAVASVPAAAPATRPSPASAPIAISIPAHAPVRASAPVSITAVKQPDDQMILTVPLASAPPVSEKSSGRRSPFQPPLPEEKRKEPVEELVEEPVEEKVVTEAPPPQPFLALPPPPKNPITEVAGSVSSPALAQPEVNVPAAGAILLQDLEQPKPPAINRTRSLDAGSDLTPMRNLRKALRPFHEQNAEPEKPVPPKTAPKRTSTPRTVRSK